MTKQSNELLVGVIVDETWVLSLQEISYACGVSVSVINEMIEYGIIEPQKPVASEQHFGPQALHRLKMALRLQKDLEVNWPGVALALDMLNELQELRTKIALLEQRFLQ